VSDARSTRDLVGGIFGVAALAMSILQIIWVPMAFAPLALVCLVIAIMLTPRYTGLFQTAAVVLALGFIVGSTVAVLGDNPLY
jgi:hypothetical protein